MPDLEDQQTFFGEMLMRLREDTTHEIKAIVRPQRPLDGQRYGRFRIRIRRVNPPASPSVGS